MDTREVVCHNVNCELEKVILVFVDLFVTITKDLNENRQVKLPSLEGEEMKVKIRNSLMRTLANQKLANFLFKFQSFYQLKTKIGRDIIDIHNILIGLSNHHLHKMYKIIKYVTLMNENEGDDTIATSQVPNSSLKSSLNKQQTQKQKQKDNDKLLKPRSVCKEDTRGSCMTDVKVKEIRQDVPGMLFLGKKTKQQKEDITGETNSKLHIDELTITSASTRPTNIDKPIKKCLHNTNMNKTNDVESITCSFQTDRDKKDEWNTQGGLLNPSEIYSTTLNQLKEESYTKADDGNINIDTATVMGIGEQGNNRGEGYNINPRKKLMSYAKIFGI